MLKVKNRAFGSLNSDVSSDATEWTLAAGDGARFPDAGDFHITCENEIVKCTARSNDTLTVTRAQEGTTAAAHSAGKAVELRITAGVLDSRTTWTANKLLKGAGIGIDPTEIDISGKTATFIVAASNSLEKSKAQADYVCDGTADEVELGQAYDAAVAAPYGGTIILLEGDYYFSAKLSKTLSAEKQVTIMGIGNVKNVKIHGATDSEVFEIVNASVVSNTYFGLENLRINANISTANKEAVKIYNIMPSLANIHIENTNAAKEGTGLHLGPICMGNFNPLTNVSIGFFSTNFNLEIDHLTMIYPTSYYAQSKGFYIHSAIQVTLVNPHSFVAANDAYDFYFYLIQGNLTIINPWAEQSSNTPTMFYYDTFRNIDAPAYIINHCRTGDGELYTSAGRPGLIFSGQINNYNLLKNGDFEVGAPPSEWTYSNCTATSETTTVKLGVHSLKLVSNGTWGGAEQAIADVSRVTSRMLCVAGWFNAPAANDKPQKVRIAYNTPDTEVILIDNIPKDGNWHWFTGYAPIPQGATNLRVLLRVNDGGDADTDDILYIDGITAVVDNPFPEFIPKPDSGEQGHWCP